MIYDFTQQTHYFTGFTSPETQLASEYPWGALITAGAGPDLLDFERRLRGFARGAYRGLA